MDVIEILDYYIGDLIEKIIVEKDYPVDLEEEYEDLLNYIYRKLAAAWFGSRTPSPGEFEEKLRYIKRRYRRRLEILLSYLISRYARYKSTIKVDRSREWD